jgi:hypothetical protein
LVVPGIVVPGLAGSVSPVFAVVVVAGGAVVTAGVCPAAGVPAWGELCAGVAAGEVTAGALDVALGCCAIADVTATKLEIVRRAEKVRIRME